MANTKRRIIYTDATKSKENQFKVGLYDPEINLTYTLLLKENVNNVNEAEKYGILYALYYINRNQLENAHILNDSLSSVNDKKLKKLATYLSIQISWIPREINLVADKIARLEPTQKEEVWYDLSLLNNLIHEKHLEK
ncbi:hypothetical protein [Halarcobacter sp.]|uniref:hypothetical protein n=1 Tax=Halarcobacter sp. TaxID=2321133 RepID=UPI0029F55BA8|nr:hypothetical protein [Halarcobacter sp.]